MKIGKIEKDVPVPEDVYLYDGRYKYGFENMEIGDSILIEFPYEEETRARRRISTAKHRASRKLGWKFYYRTVEKGASTIQIRMWRME